MGNDLHIKYRHNIFILERSFVFSLEIEMSDILTSANLELMKQPLPEYL